MVQRILTVTLALALAAAPAAAADKVRVGFIATFSGPVGLLGQHAFDGFLGRPESGRAMTLEERYPTG